jgi:ribosome modulation factor
MSSQCQPQTHKTEPGGDTANESIKAKSLIPNDPFIQKQIVQFLAQMLKQSLEQEGKQAHVSGLTHEAKPYRQPFIGCWWYLGWHNADKEIVTKSAIADSLVPP